MFCTFSLRNLLRATTACNFSSLIWPAGSAPAALASLLFDPPEPHIIGKTQCFATFLPFRASASSFFCLFLFSDLLSSNLSLLSASALLCFSSVHIVGSLTSKLPSIIRYYNMYMTVERCIYIYIHTHYSIYFYKKVRKTQIIAQFGTRLWFIGLTEAGGFVYLPRNSSHLTFFSTRNVETN